MSEGFETYVCTFISFHCLILHSSFVCVSWKLQEKDYVSIVRLPSLLEHYLEEVFRFLRKEALSSALEI